jgi:hypothetical protein
MFRIIGKRFSVISSFFMDWLKWSCYDAYPMKILRWLPLFVIALYLSAVAKTGGMTDEDREHLLVHFEMTGRMLAEEVRGLSPTQLEYRASPIAGQFGNALPIWRLLNPTTGVN